METYPNAVFIVERHVVSLLVKINCALLVKRQRIA